jgi:hypothetical protein
MGILRDLGNMPGDAANAMEYSESDDKLVIHTSQDVEPLLERNVAFQNSGLDGYTPSRDMQQVASIPAVWLDYIYKHHGIKWWDEEDTPRLMALLDDPAFKDFRTGGGHLGKRPYRQYFRASSGSI